MLVYSSIAALCGSLDSTDWDVIMDTSQDINDAVTALTGYIQLCDQSNSTQTTNHGFRTERTAESKKETVPIRRYQSRYMHSYTEIAVQYKIRKKITECKASYKNKVQSLFSHDARRAWQGLQTMTGYRPKTHAFKCD